MNNVVIEHRENVHYTKSKNFRPSTRYPEYLFEEINLEKNDVYDMVRECFHNAGYDKENYNSPSWNPLSTCIKPGDVVLIKPNMVMDVNVGGYGEECLYTQPSVVAAVLDYVYIALKGKGTIVVGDAPMQECNFVKLIEDSGYKSLIEWCKEKYEGVDVQLIDFRGVRSEVVNGVHVYYENPQSSTTIDLGADSEFSALTDKQMRNVRITNYDPDLLQSHHNKNKHEYIISNYVLKADVIINMPKPKTHRNAGVTISLKNLVGINTRKEYLPHHTNGSIGEGGDEYLNKSIIKRIKAVCLDNTNREAQTKKNIMMARFWRFCTRCWSYASLLMDKDRYSEGSWYGNNTISKTILDLNKIVFYADKSGKMQNTKQRRYLIVADMVISGEKEGPLLPTPKPLGIVAIGENPVTFDKTIATLMGADISKIPTLAQLKSKKVKYVIGDNCDGVIISNDSDLNNKSLVELQRMTDFSFVPADGWKESFNK
ncbi:MAG: DUF362 domain-containing protein [Erysipelotrichaceae bacterium]|nr:DUF362 domain-containing protein [Erysipelotrichaceae bacterium]